MKCPFELPAEKYEPMKIIRDKKGDFICGYEDDEDADYILQTINSHEKLVRASDHAYGFMICVSNLDNEENLEWQEKVAEELKQALKEAE